MSATVVETGQYLQGTTSQLVARGRGQILGVFVTASSSGTLKFWDNTSAATTVLVDTFSVTAGQFYPLPFTFGTGLFVTVGGTATYTISYLSC